MLRIVEYVEGRAFNTQNWRVFKLYFLGILVFKRSTRLS